MSVGWLEVVVATLFLSVVVSLVLARGRHWFEPGFWKVAALPLVAMVVHAVYDAGVHKLQTVNRPALFWAFAQAFGNLFGAGVWGFMHTLPQINLYSHGTQMAAAHGHLAFFGAYVSANLALFYYILGKTRVKEGYILNGVPWKIAYVGLIVGIFGMTAALTVAGFTQTMIERATLGSTWEAYIQAQMHPWMEEAFKWRLFFGVVFILSYLVLIYDLITAGKRVEQLKEAQLAG
jgi:nitric oxide reductase subunit B